MKPSEFAALSEVDQAIYLLEQGVEIAKRSYKGFEIHLYQTPFCYVEIFCHKHSFDFYAFRSFENTDLLESYLQNINLQHLLASVKGVG